jgi:hypothetical protein
MKNYKAYLRKRPQYGDMIHEVEDGPTGITYPDRRATLLRNSHYLSRFDGDQSFINLEEQQNNMMRQQIMEATLRQMARDRGFTHRFYRAAAPEPRQAAPNPRQAAPEARQAEYFNMAGDDDNISVDSFSDVNTEAEMRAQAEFSRQERNAGLFQEAVNADDLAEEMREAINQDFLNAPASPRSKATKREPNQEAEPAKGSKVQKLKQVSATLGNYRERPRSRTPPR